ncbi:MAG: metallophosphoesterase family protein [Candidatus Hodarchaeota archaeon]
MQLKLNTPINNRPNDLMYRVIIIGDTHCSQRSEFFKPDVFRRGVAEVNRIKNVDFIVHLGDLTQNGVLEDYEYALDLFRSFSDDRPIYYILGNHDARSVGDLLFEQMVGKRSFEIETSDLYCIGLDTSKPDQDGGALGRRTIRWLRARLLKNMDKIKIVAFHHHLLPIPFTGRERSSITDAGDVLQVMLETKVDLVVNGHRHITNLYHLNNGGGKLVHYCNGTFSAKKTRYTEPNSYSVIDLYNDRFEIRTQFLRPRSPNIYIFNRQSPPPSFAFREEELVGRIVHISDSHFTTKFKSQPLFHVYSKAVDLINKIQPNLVIHSGDVTNNSMPDEFIIAQEMIEKIHSPLLAVPGNTDAFPIGEHLFEEVFGSHNPVGSFQTSDNLHINAFGLNSTKMEEKGGEIGRRKLDDLLKNIEKNEIQIQEGILSPNRVYVAFFHHRVVPCPRTVHRGDLEDSGDVLRRIVDSPIDLVLSAHDHVTFVVQIEQTVFSSIAAISSDKLRTLRGNAFGIISFYADRSVKVEEFNLADHKTRIIGRFYTKNGMNVPSHT